MKKFVVGTHVKELKTAHKGIITDIKRDILSGKTYFLRVTMNLHRGTRCVSRVFENDAEFLSQYHILGENEKFI